MSSSGPYQSKFFNLLSRQTRRLQDQTRRTLRQLQVGITWGAQILLYPIYVIFQSSRLVGRQIKQAVRRTLPRLQAAQQQLQQLTHPTRPPSCFLADTPIIRTLQAVQAFALPVPVNVGGLAIAPSSSPAMLLNSADGNLALASSHEIATVPPPLDPVQGIATLLATRSLVLVTGQNHILDILSPEQQLQLHRRMVWEIASYLRQHHILQASQWQAPILLLPPVDRPTLLPPVRWFRRLMGWMQQGPVAIATNLFQEAALASYTPAPGTIDPYTSLTLTDDGEEEEDGDRLLPYSPHSYAPPPSWYAWLPISAARPPAPSPQPLLSRSHPSNSRELPLLLRSAPPIPAIALVPAPAIAIHPPKSIKSTPAAAMPPVSPTAAPLAVVSPVSPSLQPPNPPDSATQIATTVNESKPIDIQATLVGYVKHPLEQLLDWLDQGMLWLEDHIAKIISWIQRQLNG